MKSRLAVALLVFLAAAPAAAKEDLDNYPPVSVEMPLKRISEHVWYVQGLPRVATKNEGFISNAGAIVTGEGVVVFDALGTPSLAAKFIRRIREVTDQPIRKVIVSHYHADHVYGLQVFKELGAEIIAPAGAMKYIEGDVSQKRLAERRQSLEPWVNEETRLVVPDVLLNEDMKFELGGVTFQINLQGAAHSEGDLTLHVMPDNLLFTADLIFEGRLPFLGSANTKTWLEKLEELEQSRVKALIPGHGSPASDPVALVSLTRRYLEMVRREMGAAVEEWTPFDEAYEAVDWSEFMELPAFAEINRSNAYGVYVSMQQELLDE